MVLPYNFQELRYQVTHETILRSVQMVSVLIIFIPSNLFMFTITNRTILTLVMMK